MYKNARICENNRLETATIIAPEDVSFPFVNCYDLVNRGKLYKPGTKSFTIEADLGVNANITFFAILGASDDYLKISNAATITIKANDINLFDGTEPLSVSANVGELGVYYNFEDSNNTDGVQYRYWQIVVDDSLNPEDVAIAYIYLGDNVILHRNVAKGFNISVVDNTLIARSDSGKVFSRRRTDSVTLSGISMTVMTLDDRDKLMLTVRKLRRDVPFLFVLDPNEQLETYDFTVLPVYFTRPPTFRHITRNRYSSTFAMNEVI